MLYFGYFVGNRTCPCFEGQLPAICFAVACEGLVPVRHAAVAPHRVAVDVIHFLGESAFGFLAALEFFQFGDVEGECGPGVFYGAFLLLPRHLGLVYSRGRSFLGVREFVRRVGGIVGGVHEVL